MNAFTPFTSTAALWRCRTEGEESPAQGERGHHRPESASKDVGLGEEVTLKHRVLYKLGLCTLRSYLVRTR